MLLPGRAVDIGARVEVGELLCSCEEVAAGSWLDKWDSFAELHTSSLAALTGRSPAFGVTGLAPAPSRGLLIKELLKVFDMENPR